MTYTVGYFAILLRLCQSYKLNLLMFGITFSGFILSFPLMYVLMYYCNLGYIGAGLGIICTDIYICIQYIIHNT